MPGEEVAAPPEEPSSSRPGRSKRTDRARVDAIVSDRRWRTVWARPATTLRPIVDRTIQATGLRVPPCEVTVTLADDTAIADLNRAYRGRNGPTNVLSFPQFGPTALASLAAGWGKGPDAVPLGDVVIAYDTVVREADAAGKTVLDHATHLMVHGTLHLLGHDHIKAAEARRMEDLERAILAALGIADPYRAERVSANG